MKFVLQREACSAAEKATVRTGLSLMDGADLPSMAPSLTDLTALPRGALRAEGRGLLAPCPVGSVEFCRAWMHAVAAHEPTPLDYPPCLHVFLEREVRQYGDASRAPPGAWVKPVRTKAWTATRLEAGHDAPGVGPVWTSAHLDIRAEFRVYVIGSAIAGAGRYDDGEDDRLTFDSGLVEQMIQAYRASGEAPAAYALDVALLRDGRTALVEVTDAWAIGYYRGSLGPRDYVRMLWERWQEIAGGG